MPTNKIINLVFSDIINKQKIGKFLNVDDELDVKPPSSLLDLYQKTLHGIYDEILFLADLEEIITQYRAYDYIPNDFNLSVTNGFIYAKIPFYRKSNKIKDIRIIVGRTEEFGDDLNDLYDNQNFIDTLKDKAKSKIYDIISQNIIKMENKLVDNDIYIEK